MKVLPATKTCINGAALKSASPGEVRFGKIYEMEDLPVVTARTIQLLREKAAQEKIDVAVGSFRMRKGILFTQEDLPTGKFFESYSQTCAQYLADLQQRRQELREQYQILQNEAKRSVIEHTLQGFLVNPDADGDRFERAFQNAFAQYESNPTDENLKRIIAHRLKSHIKPEAEESHLFQEVKRAFRNFEARTLRIASRIETDFSTFAKQNDPLLMYQSKIPALEKALSGKTKPLKPTDVERWLKAGIFDINRGTRKSWWPLRRITPQSWWRS